MNGLVLALDAGNNKSYSTNRFVSYGTGLTTQNVTFSVNGDGTFQRVATGTVIGGYTVKTTDVVYSYALGSNGCHFHGNDVAMPAGVYATFSFDYLVTGATNYPSTDFLANFEQGFSNSIGTANNLQNVWQRRTFTSGPSGSAASLRMLLYPGGCGGRLADSGTLYFRNPRVEWSNVDTGTENFSSMSNTTTWYDMSGRGNNGTLTNTPYFFIGNISTGSNGYISFDGTDDFISVTKTSQFDFGTNDFTIQTFCNLTSKNTSYPCIFGNYSSYGSGSIYFGYGHDSVPTKYSAHVNNTAVLSSSTNVIYGSWTQLTLVRSSGVLYFYLNGTLDGTPVNMSSSLNGNGSLITIGKANDGSSAFTNGYISDFKIYNRALTAAEIQQNFNATRGRFGI